jgi:hypothetical protein
LRRISGLGLPAEPDLWRTWAAKEGSSQDVDDSELRAIFADPDLTAQVTNALALARHAGLARIGREAVAEVLERPEPGLRRLACES